jgi:predicted CopG family antitoxin
MTYDSLERLREKRESFSKVIDRLVKAYSFILTINQPKKE